MSLASSTIMITYHPFEFGSISNAARVSRFILIPRWHLQAFGRQSRWTKRFPFRSSSWLGRRTHRLFINEILGKFNSSFSHNLRDLFDRNSLKNVDRGQLMGWMVGRRRLLPDTSRRQRMWNRKLRSGIVAACSFEAKNRKNSAPTILVMNWCSKTATIRCSSYSISTQT